MKKSLIISALFLFSMASAQVRLPAIFGSNMVLQRNVEVPVWGWASAGEKVTVQINGQSVATTADANGNWRVNLKPMSEGGPFELQINGTTQVSLTNVLVGIVWLCSGQSNMELSVVRAANAELEIKAANYPMIRLFTVKRKVAETPLTDCVGEWEECTPASVDTFSAAAYFFGRELYRTLNIPIGLVHSSYGGSPAEAWMTPGALASDPEFASITERWNKTLADYPEKKEEFAANRAGLLKAWEEEASKAKAEGRMPPTRPSEPPGPGNRSTPSGLFNGMLSPVIPFAFDGVIWYQGESNASRAYQYRKLFPALILDWRKAWNQELPFYFVQLPNLNRQPEPSRSGWAELRESQLMTLRLPRTAMAVTIDVGDPANLHPQNKQDVGYRLALAAEALVYGKKDIGYSGPLYSSSRVDPNRVRIEFTFNHGMKPKVGTELKGFTIAGEDRVFVTANAKVDGETVVVWSDAVPKPAAVRYAWADNPDCNLVNISGLPASPFRTDDWPEVTFGRK